jgi:outer membrane protein
MLQSAADLEVAMQAHARWFLVLFLVAAAVPAAAGKIGFLDAERAVATVEEGKVQVQAFQDWAAPRRQEIEQLRSRVAELSSQLEAQRSVASADAVSKLETDLIQARRAFEDAGRSFNREFEQKQDEFLGEVARKVGEVASEYGRENGYDAIFLYNAQPLAFIAEGANVTDIVIERYNQRFPVE